ncbi:MAG: tRNA glutamyl-Q(34) synthetase GluQRS, partial [Proteobacteria bacterium]|nr:tRNA glutamyl-Q(34) synthetase GluQRS [Pseudomonadota bacterium]
VTFDDAHQGVTLVTRGEDLFHATHIQVLLQALLNLPTPAYSHHRLILNVQGKKFSKRDTGANLRTLRESGTSVRDIRAMVGLTNH